MYTKLRTKLRTTNAIDYAIVLVMVFSGMNYCLSITSEEHVVHARSCESYGKFYASPIHNDLIRVQMRSQIAINR